MLSIAMQENALFSAVSGGVLIAGAPWLDEWLGVNAWILAALGIGLLVYAADLVWWARTPRLLVPGARLAVAADILWVVGAAALIAFTGVLTAEGEIALAVVSLVVAGFAVAQWIGLRRLEAARV